MRPMNALKYTAFVLLVQFGLSALPNVAQAAPEVGDPAPDFELIGSDGRTYTLSQFRGEKPVVIAFFPKAFTGG